MFLSIGRLLRSGFLFLLWIDTSYQQEEVIPHNEVKNWAIKFGVDLWEFGKQVTKMSEIQRRYHEFNIEVGKKDGLVLVREMAAEVKNMMDSKMNAVMKLMESAEQAAVSAPRDGSSSSRYYASHRLGSFVGDGKAGRDSFMVPNRHFDQLSVNLTMSAILLPAGIKENDPDVTSGIQWTEYLDPLFVNNYESDPSLSWQYFGSTAGFLRRFPAITWPPMDGYSKHSSDRVVRDVYDFRVANWFVGGASSAKDLTILIHGESLSSDKKRRLTLSTVKTILETLGPNDYVNVYQYGERVVEVLECFKDSLVQASPKNLQELKTGLHSLKPEEGVANVSAALSVAFEILHKYNRTGQGSQCNQAIILITSDSEGLPNDVIKRYNWPHMPVRIFAYLVGGDKSPELHSTACANKGFYAIITNTEDIKSRVFEFVKVLARPMVLYQHDHPIHWSPAYLGGRSSIYGRENRAQLMTSVTAPILDRRNHTVKTANLLGIVGTDVPVEEIQKLVPPYKLGVNGYSFIVDNNGRVLYHPDLRPLPRNADYEETLKPTYVSVDLSEVELAESDGPSHPWNNSLLLDLRRDMIDQKEGETGFAAKMHYDDMKRVTIRRHKYFYKPIEGSPFSLGIALPERYGMYELLAEQEIKHANENVTEHFKGNYWKVHPDWVYCEYNSASDKWFSTPEERVLHFLARTHGPAWKWMSLRPRSPSSNKQASKPDKDAYYCDKRLIQSLVLDAHVTEGFNKKHENSMHKEENQKQGKGRFGVQRSFIATRSGLLRWHEHQQLSEDVNNEPSFAEFHARAMDSSWYKRAVDQHSVEPESFVFSVPFDAAESSNPLVTATHAIFIENQGHKAPAAVVGLQIQHASLASHFVNITSSCIVMSGCKKTCASEDLDCYILDNAGFVIISERYEHTGKFFGEIDGTIMDSLVQDKIFRNVTVVDYQGKCSPQESHLSAASRISNTIIRFFWHIFIDMNIPNLWQSVWAYADDSGDDGDDDSIINVDDEDDEMNDFEQRSEEPLADVEEFSKYPAAEPIPASPPTTRATSAHYLHRKLRACEKRTDLFILQPDRLNTSNPLKGKLTNCHVSGCERPFSVQKIQHTNLILLVVDTLCPCGSKQLSIEPTETVTKSGTCSARKERLYRRRPPKCLNYHPEEMEIKYCGLGFACRSDLFTLSIVVLLMIVPRLT